VQTRKELAATGGESQWAILVEYLDSPDKSGGEQQIKGKVDYREILNAADFSLFSKLRDVRKRLAEENGLPVYAVCTNEQLAEIAKRRPKNLSECMKIESGRFKERQLLARPLQPLPDKRPQRTDYFRRSCAGQGSAACADESLRAGV